MEAGKHSASSPEKDTDGVGRSYECTFCKRGFTNAQALGGHMNIHRKDKAKTKQKNQEEASLNKSKEGVSYSRFVPTTDPRAVGGHMGYQLFLPSWNPNFQTGNYLPPFRPPDRLEGRMEANLSLRVGAAPPPDGEGGAHVESSLKENEVDLELRLGP